jgi:hypothetical protein
MNLLLIFVLFVCFVVKKSCKPDAVKPTAANFKNGERNRPSCRFWRRAVPSAVRRGKFGPHTR